MVALYLKYGKGSIMIRSAGNISVHSHVSSEKLLRRANSVHCYHRKLLNLLYYRNPLTKRLCTYAYINLTWWLYCHHKIHLNGPSERSDSHFELETVLETSAWFIIKVSRYKHILRMTIEWLTRL